MGFFNRTEAKWRAREAMRGSYPHPMLVSLVYLLLTTGVTSLITRFVADPFNMAYLYMLDGRYEIETILQYVFTPARVATFLGVELVLGLYRGVAGFGYVSYSLRLARGEQPGYRNLLDGFQMMGRVLAAQILIALFVWLWTMLALIPYVVVLIVAIVLESRVMLVLAFALMVFPAVVSVIMDLRYRLSYYFLVDNPDMGAMEAIRHSKEAMKGWKGTLFLLDLSFLGWALLAPFTLGILLLWLTPYMGATEANFYDHVVHGSFGPLSGTSGPGGGGGGYTSNYGQGPRRPGNSF